MFLHGVLLDGAVGREDVLLVDVDVVEEVFPQLLDAAVLGVGQEREVLVRIECHDILEAQLLFPVAAYQFVIDRY